MTRLRIGTRGSALARTQTAWVADALKNWHGAIEIETIVVKTSGDVSQTTAPEEAGWQRGAFVSALEHALLDGRIDAAVHSMKDLPTSSPEGLTVAAVPARAAVEDLLVTKRPLALDDLTTPMTIGTGSARRRAQLLLEANHTIVPIRGNVPTRIKRLHVSSLDAIVLAAAGVHRLNIELECSLVLPASRFLPAPAQGALAIQTRLDDAAHPLVAALDVDRLRKAVVAERAFMHEAEAGCQTPIGALATVYGADIALCGQLFLPDGTPVGMDTHTGNDPDTVGRELARKLLGRSAPHRA